MRFSMSVFCWEMSPLALRWISLIPSFFASAVIDLVSVSRNGLLVDSDCENPTVADFRSSFGAPYFWYVHFAVEAPAAAVVCCAPPVPAPDPAGADVEPPLEALFAQAELTSAAERIAVVTATAPRRGPVVESIRVISFSAGAPSRRR